MHPLSNRLRINSECSREKYLLLPSIAGQCAKSMKTCRRATPHPSVGGNRHFHSIDGSTIRSQTRRRGRCRLLLSLPATVRQTPTLHLHFSPTERGTITSGRPAHVLVTPLCLLPPSPVGSPAAALSSVMLAGAAGAA